ncbi:MAG: helical backbone metal receptor, partial [Saprospiraceae bacterium]
ESKDQMGNVLHIPYPPKRIVSLVPSQTELLFDLGLKNEICGITTFCIHPKTETESKEKVGGTKKLNIERIHSLQPDLIIGNKEENEQERIHELQKFYPVWMSDIVNLSDAYTMIRELARVTNRPEAGIKMANEISNLFANYTPIPDRHGAVYFIWRKPYMVAAGGTFINEMLQRFGVDNVFGHINRYPEVTLEMVAENNPQFIFLSSEPYPFSEKHVEEFRKKFPSSQVMIVDGEYFSWYGSRLLHVPAYFEKLKSLCKNG